MNRKNKREDPTFLAFCFLLVFLAAYVLSQPILGMWDVLRLSLSCATVKGEIVGCQHHTMFSVKGKHGPKACSITYVYTVPSPDGEPRKYRSTEYADMKFCTPVELDRLYRSEPCSEGTDFCDALHSYEEIDVRYLPTEPTVAGVIGNHQPIYSFIWAVLIISLVVALLVSRLRHHRRRLSRIGNVTRG